MSALRQLFVELLEIVEGDDELRELLRAIVREGDHTLSRNDGPCYLSVADVVERSGLSEKTVRRAIKTEELRSTRKGSRRLIAVDDFEAWMTPEPSRETRRTGARPRVEARTSFVATLRSRRQ